MEIGKVSNNDLNNYVFKNIKKRREEVLAGPNIGMDTSVLDFGGDLIVISTDPITGATKDLGKLAIHVSCNDVSCECADPVGVLMTILLPPSASLEELEEIVKDANAECERLNVEIIGGHTEVTDAVNRIVVSTTVIGRVKKEHLPQREKIEEGDVIAISKYVGIEGTSIIFNEKYNEINKLFNEEEIKELKNMSKSFSVVEESKIARNYRVKHLHDITEGGIYGAIWETANSIDKKIIVDFDLIPVLDFTKKIANYYNINLYRLISSGSMIMVIAKDDFLNYKNACEKENIKITKIGVVEKGQGAFIRKDEEIYPIEEPGSDELYKVM